MQDVNETQNAAATGQLIQSLLAFLQTPAGQAIEQALIAYLATLLTKAGYKP